MSNLEVAYGVVLIVSFIAFFIFLMLWSTDKDNANIHGWGIFVSMALFVITWFMARDKPDKDDIRWYSVH